jgi:23S rRNA (uracil1939-C5)-methyltransferase
VRARVAGGRAEVLEVLRTSAERQDPACRHFGRCGGCQLQHWRDEPYLAWKRAQVVDALTKRGFGGAQVEPTIAAWGAGRRRAALHAARQNNQVRIGFIERGGARLTPISQCPVLAPQLEATVLKLGPLAELALPARGEITLQCLLTDAGVDISIKGAGRVDLLHRAALENLIAEANALNLARLSFDGDPIIERAKPTLRMGKALVSPPPGAFLQPTAFGEETLARLTLEALQGAKRVVDLFSGIGTFALRLARKSAVHAVEFDAPALAALDHAARHAQGLKPVGVERRDLFRRPMLPLDLKYFDGVCFDPPRAGAEQQCRELAKSKVQKIAAVSCNPTTLARDLRILIDGGYKLKSVTPIDQFLWSSHVEAVALLER